MSKPQNELIEKFDAFIELKDPEEFFLAFTEYLRFIQETPPLHTIARKMLSDSRFFEINSLYKTLQRGWLEDDNAAKEIWADTNRQILGAATKYEPTALFGRLADMRLARAQIRMLHEHLRGELEKVLPIQGQEIERAITRNVDGDYYYKGKKLPFKKEAIYHHIFDCLYDLPNNEASYSDINSYLEKKGFEMTADDKFHQSERIRNAIKVYEKSKKFPKTIGNLRVFEIRHGFGVRLNNPEI